MTQTAASGAVTTYGYDSRGRAVSVSHMNSDGVTAISSEAYVYDLAGNLTSKTVDGLTTSYAYDAVDQMLSESNSGYSASYTYDANGNRTSKTVGGVVDAYTVDAGDKLTSTSAKSYGYDAAGRTTSVTGPGGTTTLTYDYEDRVTGISYPGGGSNTFTYNGLDTRVGKVDSAGANAYLRDGIDVTDPVLSDSGAVYTPGVSEHRGGVSTFLHSGMKDATVQTSATQTVTARRVYDAFGNVQSVTGTWSGPFGYVGGKGYQEDGDSGLQLLGHRYYDPSTGRFLTRDHVKDGRNWYGYCRNNPTKFVDPSGHCWLAIAAAIVVVIGLFILAKEAGAQVGAAMTRGKAAKLEQQDQAQDTSDGPPDDRVAPIMPPVQYGQFKKSAEFTKEQFKEAYGPAGIGGSLPGKPGDIITVGGAVWDYVKALRDSGGRLKLGPRD